MSAPFGAAVDHVRAVQRICGEHCHLPGLTGYEPFVARGDACRSAVALSSRGASSPSSPHLLGGAEESARGIRVPWPRVADARGRNIDAQV